jgi:hypothetical protein
MACSCGREIVWPTIGADALKCCHDDIAEVLVVCGCGRRHAQSVAFQPVTRSVDAAEAIASFCHRSGKTELIRQAVGGPTDCKPLELPQPLRLERGAGE